jgi:uncharacterized membrane protein YeaQ/YmgE (transglycosylase-associated protein family)
MASDPGDSGVGDTSNWSGGSDSVVQLIVDQIEELILTLLEEIRARPGVAMAIGAGIAGAIFGTILAARLATRRRRPPPVSATSEMLGALAGTLVGAIPRRVDGTAIPKAAGRVSKRAQKQARGLSNVGDMADLAGLAMRLLENPIVRSYARAAVANQLRKRFRS